MSLYGISRTPLFTDVWHSAEEMINDYKASGLYLEEISDTQLATIFYLTYSRYGNSAILLNDTNRFKYSYFSKIFQYAPTWIKRLDVQKQLRALSIDELREGDMSVYNEASNPAIDPSTDAFAPLPFINGQRANKYKRGKLDTYANLMVLLEADVTEQFITKFGKLFNPFIDPQEPLYYTSKPENGIDDTLIL